MKNPEIVAELRRLAAENGGILKPEAVVDAARDDESPLHSQFEWDDTEAAAAYRLYQARHLIARVVVTYESAAGKTDHQVFVSVTTDRKAEGGGYRVLADALSDAELKAQMMADARASMLSFRAKYARLTELADVLNEMAKAEHRMEEQSSVPA